MSSFKVRARRLTQLSILILTALTALIFSPLFAGQEAQSEHGFAFSEDVKSQDNLLGTATSLCTAPPAGIIAWYTGDDTPADVQSNIYGLTLYNGVAYADGKVGRAFSFDGTNDYAEMPTAPPSPISYANRNLDIPDKITISFWAKRQDLTRNDVIIEKNGGRGSGTTNYGVGLDSINNKMFYFFYAGGWKGVDGVNDTDWHHYAVVAVNGQNNPKFYIDGVEKTIAHASGANNVTLFVPSMPSLTNNLHLGAQVATSGNIYSKTLLDEVMIFQNTLTVANVQSLFNAGSAGACRNISYVPPTPNGKFLFRNGTTIYQMNSDGTNRTKIVTMPNLFDSSSNPKWSPNGGRFSSGGISGGIGYLANTDGSGTTRVPLVAPSFSPTNAMSYLNWSPDGLKLVFTYKNAPQSKPEIYTSNLDGTNLTRITTTTSNFANFNNYNAEWSPDGTKIVFTSTREASVFQQVQNSEIYVVDADGSNGANPTRLTSSDQPDEKPTWSPDSSRIAFVSSASGVLPVTVYTIKPDGTDLTVVQAGNFPGYTLQNSFVGWSPDGSKVYFVGMNVIGNMSIFQKNADGTGDPTLVASFSSGDTDFTVQRAAPQGVVLSSNLTGANAANSATLALLNITQPGNAAFAPIPPSSIGNLPANYVLPPESVAYEIQSSAQAGNFRVCFNVTNINDPTTFARLRVLHNVNGNVVDETALPNDFANRQVCANTTSLSPFAIAQNLAPSAATVSVGGRVTTADGRGLRNARVTIIGTNGEQRTVLTGIKGTYRFADVPVGDTYIIEVSAKRYTFSQSSQVRLILDETEDINFTADN